MIFRLPGCRGWLPVPVPLAVGVYGITAICGMLDAASFLGLGRVDLPSGVFPYVNVQIPAPEIGAGICVAGRARVLRAG